MNSNNNESVIKKSRCNYRGDYLSPFDWTGGELFLTKWQLSFRSNSFNLRNREESIQLEDVVSIQAKYSDFISNKLSILLRNGSIKEFRVPRRNDWVKTIKEAVNQNRKAHGEDSSIDETAVSIPKRPEGWYLKIIIQALVLVICVALLAFIFQRFMS